MTCPYASVKIGVEPLVHRSRDARIEKYIISKLFPMASTKKPTPAPKAPFKSAMPPLWQAARLDGKQRNMGIKNFGKQQRGKRGDR